MMSGKRRESPPGGGGCPETPLPLRSQLTDSVRPEFLVLDAHKEFVFGHLMSGNATYRELVSPIGILLELEPMPFGRSSR